MEQITFNVKEKSASDFFEKNLVGYNNREMERQSPHYFFKDEIFIRKPLLVIGANVVFTLEDKGTANKLLLNTYTYKVENYDDVSVKLTLINFEVKAIQ